MYSISSVKRNLQPGFTQRHVRRFVLFAGFSSMMTSVIDERLGLSPSQCSTCQDYLAKAGDLATPANASIHWVCNHLMARARTRFLLHVAECGQPGREIVFTNTIGLDPFATIDCLRNSVGYPLFQSFHGRAGRANDGAWVAYKITAGD